MDSSSFRRRYHSAVETVRICFGAWACRDWDDVEVDEAGFETRRMMRRDARGEMCSLGFGFNGEGTHGAYALGMAFLLRDRAVCEPEGQDDDGAIVRRMCERVCCATECVCRWCWMYDVLRIGVSVCGSG
jgi:hypothetical protein